MTPIQTLTIKIFTALLGWGGPASLGRKAANLAAGWLALLRLVPPLPQPPQSTWMHVLTAALFIPLVFIALAPGLNFAQPILRAAGSLSAGVYALAAVVGVNLWRYRAGKKLLAAFESTLR